MLVKWILSRISEFYNIFEGLIQTAWFIWLFVSFFITISAFGSNLQHPNGEPMVLSAQFQSFLAWNCVVNVALMFFIIGRKIYRTLQADYSDFVANFEKQKRH